MENHVRGRAEGRHQSVARAEGGSQGGSGTLGPYAWVQGRRATSKVTATSEDRLTHRYAWATGRLTRRAYLGVKLPLRVPPCKHYPDEVTELKMAARILLRYRQRRLLRRNRIFRDRTNPLDKFDDSELFRSLHSHERIFCKWPMKWKISSNIRIGRARCPLFLQVLLALRFYASGSFQDICAELIGVDQSTASRTTQWVTVATSWVAFTCRVTKPFSMPTVRRLFSAGVGVRVRKGKSRYRLQCRRPAMHSFSWGMHPMTSHSAGNTRYGHSCTKASQAQTYTEYIQVHARRPVHKPVIRFLSGDNLAASMRDLKQMEKIGSAVASTSGTHISHPNTIPN